MGRRFRRRPLDRETEAINEGVPAPVITLALQMRFASRDQENYAAWSLAEMRNQSGGMQSRRSPS